MITPQLIILAILGCTIILFVWGRWRHDVVALISLLACVLTGLVPADHAFSGFSHPAVVTVACVLILSAGLQSTGAVDVLARRLLPTSTGRTASIAALTGLGAALSALMNNVGAMALLMPVAVKIAGRLDLPAGKVLMPLAFGTILGGMTTLIGTPPNLIVSAFRSETGMTGFGMFDYTPVGVSVAGVGVLFTALLGWRLVPGRDPKGMGGFDTGTYITELRVSQGSASAGKRMLEVDRALEEADIQIVGLVRNDLRIYAPNPLRTLQPGDILLIEAEPEALSTALADLGLELEEIAAAGDDEAEGRGDGPRPAPLASEGGDEGEQQEIESPTGETEFRELVVMSTSPLIGRTASEIQLRTRYGLNLLAFSRQGRRSIKRLRTTRLQSGDVLLVQGQPDALAGFETEFGCVPLEERDIHIPDKGKASLATLVMLLAIGGAAFGLLPAAISFALGVLAFVLLRIVPVRKLYSQVDWPVIVLLGALIPVAEALSSTGTADRIAQFLLVGVSGNHPVMALSLIMAVTMTLSDFTNNAATAAMMCPIAISSAGQLGVSLDPFLMAVAVGASCAFLTPIGHQNNTLILGPGGFKFTDYWRLGLPMEIIVLAVGIPVLLLAWPL